MADNTTSLAIAVDFISDQEYTLFLKIYMVFYTTLGLTGIVSNCINIYVFIKMGLSDIVTITFFSLSIADLGVTTCSTIAGVCLCLTQIQEAFPLFFLIIDPWAVFILSANTMCSFVQGSILLTAFLAVQRCCCVALPFGFRRVFTKKFVICVIVVVFLVTAFFISAFGSIYLLEWRQASDGSNVSTLQLVPTSHRTSLVHYTTIAQVFGITILSEIVVLFCLVVMTIGLRRSANFRMKSKNTHEDNTSGDKEFNDSLPDSGPSKSSQQLSEQKLLKTVMFISALFVACNLVGIIHVFMLMVIPGFDTYGYFRNTFLMALDINDFCIILNSTVNMLIYYNSNTRFNTTLKASIKSLAKNK